MLAVELFGVACASQLRLCEPGFILSSFLLLDARKRSPFILRVRYPKRGSCIL